MFISIKETLKRRWAVLTCVFTGRPVVKITSTASKLSDGVSMKFCWSERNCDRIKLNQLLRSLLVQTSSRRIGRTRCLKSDTTRNNRFYLLWSDVNDCHSTSAANTEMTIRCRCWPASAVVIRSQLLHTPIVSRLPSSWYPSLPFAVVITAI